jgi:hypothetical protein
LVKRELVDGKFAPRRFPMFHGRQDRSKTRRFTRILLQLSPGFSVDVRIRRETSVGIFLLNLAVLGTQDYPLDRGGDNDSTMRV